MAQPWQYRRRQSDHIPLGGVVPFKSSLETAFIATGFTGAAVQFAEKLRRGVGQSLARLGLLGRVAVILLACLVAGGLIFWLCNELVYFFIARSYTQELADAYDLNRGVTRGILWASFAAIVVLAGFTFSFSKQKRRVGYVGLLSLVIGHSLLLGRIDANFRKNGTAEKCYVMTRTTISTARLDCLR